MAQGLLMPAAEEHYKAAEAFEAALQSATEEHVRNSLLFLGARGWCPSPTSHASSTLAKRSAHELLPCVMVTRTDETHTAHALQ